MANKTLVGLDAGKIGTIGSGDDGIINSITITNNANVGGDLTVEGDIISSGTQNSVIKDDFMDLNIGYTGDAPKAGGFTVNTAAVSGHTANPTVAFTAAVVGTTAAVNTITVTSLPANSETYVVQNLNQEFTLNFVNSGGSAGAFTQTNSQTFSANIDITADASQNAVATRIATLFNGLVDYTCTASTNTAPITGANKSQQLKITQKTDGTSGKMSTGETTVGNGQAAFIQTSGGTALAAGDMLVVASAKDTENDGIFVVSSVAANGGGQNVFIKGTASITISPDIPFAQTNFTTNADDTDGRLIQSRIFIFGVSNGSDFKDSGGSAIGIGKPIYAWGNTGVETEFTTNGNYEEVGVGNTTLQTAYDNGNTIATTTAKGDFSVSGDKSIVLESGENAPQAIQIGATAGANQTITVINTAGTSNQAIDIQANNATGGVRIRGGDGSGAGTLAHIMARGTDSVSNSGTATQTAALQLESANGGASLVAIKEIAISQISDLNSTATLTVGSYTPGGAQANSQNDVLVVGDSSAIAQRFTAFAQIAGASAVCLQGNPSQAQIVYGSGGNIPVNGTTSTITNASIAASAGGVVTITYNSGVLPGASSRVDQAVTIGTSGLANNAAGLTSVANNVATHLNSIAGVTAKSDAVDTVTIVEDQKATADNFTVNPAASGTTNALSTVANFGTALAALPTDANDTGLGSTIGFAGINRLATAVDVGQKVDVVITGGAQCLTSDGSIAFGEAVYLAAATGEVTKTAPSTAGDVIYKVGTAVSAVGGGKVSVLLSPAFIAELG